MKTIKVLFMIMVLACAAPGCSSKKPETPVKTPPAKASQRPSPAAVSPEVDKARIALADKLTREGVKLYNEEKYDEAVLKFDEAIKTLDTFSGAYSWRGRIFMERKEYDRALKDFNRAIELKPDSTRDYIYRGDIYYTKALLQSPKRVHPVYGHKQIPKTIDKEDLDDYDASLMVKAEKDYQQAIELDSNDPMTYYSLGRIYLIYEYPDKAIDVFDKALKLDPDNVEYLLIRGSSYRMKKDPESLQKAKEDLTKALKLDPKRSSIYCELGSVNLLLNDYRKGLELYNKAIELDPDFNKDRFFDHPSNTTSAYMVKGAILSDMSRYDESEKAFMKALKIRPDNFLVYSELSFLYYVTNRKEKSIEAGKKFVRYAPKPETGPDYAEHGIVYCFLGKYDISEEYLNKAVKMSPEVKSVNVDRGMLMYELGRYEEAKKDFYKALTIYPQEYERELIDRYLLMLREKGFNVDDAPNGPPDPKNAMQFELKNR